MIFHSYVKLPEGISIYKLDVLHDSPNKSTVFPSSIDSPVVVDFPLVKDAKSTTKQS